MEPESFFHVALKVEDVDDCVAFYRERFGAELLERGHADDGEASKTPRKTGGAGDSRTQADDGEGSTAVEHAALSVADKRLYLFDRAPYEAAGLVDELPVGFLHFGFVVDDVAAAHRELAEAGTDFLMEPTVFGDLKIAFLTDPAGVRVELLEHR